MCKDLCIFRIHVLIYCLYLEKMIFEMFLRCQGKVSLPTCPFFIFRFYVLYYIYNNRILFDFFGICRYKHIILWSSSKLVTVVLSEGSRNQNTLLALTCFLYVYIHLLSPFKNLFAVRNVWLKWYGLPAKKCDA